jgi:hypothetical protein
MSNAEATSSHVLEASHRPARGAELFSSYRLGELELKNRMVLSPMTRSRAIGENVPNPIAATYYVQRASAGLIITEATQVSPQGVGYIRTPGCIRRPKLPAGERSPTPYTGPAGRFSLSCGTSGAYRIRIFITAPCRLPRRRWKLPAKLSPPMAGSRS